MTYQYTAPCLFGLESIVSGELKRMGASEVHAKDGRVDFEGDFSMLARANLCLRTAERVLIRLGEFEARTFTELFDQVKQLPFEEFIGKHDAFPVKGHSIQSILKSVPDCQKIIKKAAVDRLAEKYGVSWFEETGPVHQIQFILLRDKVLIALDTSGPGLHKRGYRKDANDAPIKETLASGMLDLMRVKPESTFYDPFCGSGTFLAEAALRALNIPSGVNRKFAAQNWDCIPSEIWQQERQRGIELVRRDMPFKAYGTDLDETAVQLAIQNVKKAGVTSRVRIAQGDITSFAPTTDTGIIVTNPPYGERMLNIKDAHEIYKRMGEVFQKKQGYSYCIISPDEDFEKIFGRRADKRRKLYNGMLKCQIFMYY